VAEYPDLRLFCQTHAHGRREMAEFTMVFLKDLFHFEGLAAHASFPILRSFQVKASSFKETPRNHNQLRFLLKLRRKNIVFSHQALRLMRRHYHPDWRPQS